MLCILLCFCPSAFTMAWPPVSCPVSCEQTCVSYVLEKFTKEGCVARLATHSQIFNYINSLPCGPVVDFSRMWHITALPGNV